MDHPEGAPPVQVLPVLGPILVQVAEVVSQGVGTLSQSVDEGVLGQDQGVVHTTKHHGHHVRVLEHLPEPGRLVELAEVLLKHKEELVVAGEVGQALLNGVARARGPTVPVDVDTDLVLHTINVVLPQTLALAPVQQGCRNTGLVLKAPAPLSNPGEHRLVLEAVQGNSAVGMVGNGEVEPVAGTRPVQDLGVVQQPAKVPDPVIVPQAVWSNHEHGVIRCPPLMPGVSGKAAFGKDGALVMLL